MREGAEAPKSQPNQHSKAMVLYFWGGGTHVGGGSMRNRWIYGWVGPTGTVYGGQCAAGAIERGVRVILEDKVGLCVTGEGGGPWAMVSISACTPVLVGATTTHSCGPKHPSLQPCLAPKRCMAKYGPTHHLLHHGYVYSETNYE